MKKETAFWLKLLSQPKVYAVIYRPNSTLMRICVTKSTAKKEIKKIIKEFYWREKDLEIEEWKLRI